MSRYMSRYMKSNSLNFIEDNTGKNSISTFETKLFQDFNFKNKLALPYCQKFMQTTNFWVQFQSTDTTIDIALIHDGVSSDISTTGSIIKTENRLNWWLIEPNITACLGNYKIIVTFSDVNFESEYFEVQPSYENVSIIKWQGDETYGYNDGIYWTENQEMIIDAEIVELNNINDKTILVDTNNKMININSVIGIVDTLTVYKVPYYIKEKIQLALAHYYFEVNGIEYQTKENPELNRLGKSLFYYGEMKIQRVNYNNQ